MGLFTQPLFSGNHLTSSGQHFAYVTDLPAEKGMIRYSVCTWLEQAQKLFGHKKKTAHLTAA
jgi:hypothetical protein